MQRRPKLLQAAQVQGSIKHCLFHARRRLPLRNKPRSDHANSKAALQQGSEATKAIQTMKRLASTATLRRLPTTRNTESCTVRAPSA